MEEFYKGLDSFLEGLSDKRAEKKILDYVMAEKGYLTDEIIAYICKKTGIFETTIRGTIDFYPRYKVGAKEVPKLVICVGNNCRNSGGEWQKIITNILGSESVNGSYRYRVEEVRCLGNCATGPNIKIGGKLYKNISDSELKMLLTELKEELIDEA